jgi:putative transposase
MKRKFTEEQIIKTLSRLKNGSTAKELGREIGVTESTIYNWRKKFRDMTINEAKRLRELEAENFKLKKLVADLSLDNAMLRDVNSRKW